MTLEGHVIDTMILLDGDVMDKVMVIGGHVVDTVITRCTQREQNAQLNVI